MAFRFGDWNAVQLPSGVGVLPPRTCSEMPSPIAIQSMFDQFVTAPPSMTRERNDPLVAYGDDRS